MKHWIAILLAVCLMWMLAGCHKEQVEETQPSTAPSTQASTAPVRLGTQVELCLPVQTAQWETCAKQLQTRLEKEGHNVRANYAGGSALEQAKQIRNLVGEGADLLVVASVDTHALEEELAGAAAAGVKVVTLDRQLLHSKHISAAVTFDYVSLGVSMGYQIAETKQLASAKEENRSYTIEFLMGAADDQNAVLLHQGVMAVLQPYLDNGVLTSKTGRVSMEDTYVQRWDSELAEDKFSQYLQYYSETLPDIVCAASDELAAGCIAALTEAGYGPGVHWPAITGIGGSNVTIRNIFEGKQACTVYRDLSAMYNTCAQIVHCLLTDQPLPDQENGNLAGTGDVPTYVCTGVPVDGVKGVQKLLEYGLTEKELSLTEADIAKINAPEETKPVETEPTVAEIE